MKKASQDIFEPEMPVVPSDWAVLPFEQAADVIPDKGKRVKQGSYLLAGKIPVIDQGQDPVGGYTDDEDMAFDDELPVILFGDHTRSFKYVDKRFAVGAEGVKILRPREGYVPKFFYYLLCSLQIPSRGYSRHFYFLRKFHLPLAPEEQQKRIVAEIEKQFSRLDEAVANLKRVKANLKRYKASVLKAAVDGFLVPIKNRETTKIGEVADLVTKGSSPNWQGFTYADSGVVFVRSQNVGWGNLDLSDVAHLPPAFNEKERKSVLRTGDVLLNIVGASIGRAAVATPEIEGGNVNQAVAVIRLNKERMLPKFLMLNLLSPGTQAAIHAEKVDVARANISLSDIKDFSILFPSLAEQGTMVAEVERLLSVTDEIEITVEANLKRAERLHQSILQQAFSGQLVPEDLNAEPVSVLLESVRVESLLEEPRSTLRQREASIKEADLTMANMIEALKSASDWITAQEAFRLCGVGDGTETDAIERVYEELRDYIGSGRIAVDRRGEEDWLRLSQQLEA